MQFQKFRRTSIVVVVVSFETEGRKRKYEAKQLQQSDPPSNRIVKKETKIETVLL